MVSSSAAVRPPLTRRASLFLICWVTFSTYLLGTISGQGQEYKARYQPEFNNVKFETYLRNPRLFNLQIQCLLYDAPCDIVGRFLKPRVGKALLGECYLCTPNQEKEIQKLLVYVQEKRPDLYRLAVSKYLQKEGIAVPQEELDRNKQVEDKQGL